MSTVGRLAAIGRRRFGVCGGPTLAREVGAGGGCTARSCADRYTSRPAHHALQALYALLRLHLNFLRPVRKLLSKQRVGAKILKRYDAAQTPYQRLLATNVLTPAARAALEQQFLALNPAALAAAIQHRLERLWSLADRRPLGGAPRP